MIQARFLPSDGPNTADLLRSARAVICRVRADTQQLIAETRQKLAASICASRARLRKSSEKILQQRLAALSIEHTFESERRYREVVAQAHRDCLEVALAVAREIVGEKFTQDAEPLAAKIRTALEQLISGRRIEIIAAPSMVVALQSALARENISLPVSEQFDLPSDTVKIVTESGSLSFSWSQECTEIERRLRSLLEVRLEEGTV